MKYLVIRDTREKIRNGWIWKPSKYCLGTHEGTLQTGDYTIQGYHKLLTIERKGSISEWAQNITQARVERELERMEEIRFPFVLLEFTMTDIMNYPIGSDVPKKLWPRLKVRGSYILKRTIEFEMQYRTKIIFCGGSGKEIASSIFKRTVEIIEHEQIDVNTAK